MLMETINLIFSMEGGKMLAWLTMFSVVFNFCYNVIM